MKIIKQFINRNFKAEYYVTTYHCGCDEFTHYNDCSCEGYVESKFSMRITKIFLNKIKRFIVNLIFCNDYVYIDKLYNGKRYVNYFVRKDKVFLSTIRIKGVQRRTRINKVKIVDIV
jgi:hypothetical protein